MSDRGGTLNIAIAGATGAVGREMIKLVETRLGDKVANLVPLASERSSGTVVPFQGRAFEVETLGEDSFKGVDVALFSAGGSISKAFGPIAAQAGAIVVDNSSAFRQEADVPLVVPEVNREAIGLAFPDKGGRGIIANPNCSTIQMVVALKPLHDKATLKRIVVSTYQSVSGAGRSGISELLDATRALVGGLPEPAAERFAHPIAFNALPHIDVFLDNGFTREEMKMVWETRKIMGLPDLQVSATCVRIPVIRAHSEAVTAEFEETLSAAQARSLLRDAPGIAVVDDPEASSYPLARNADGFDETFVGRIRNDLDRPGTLHMWVVSDNLRKGAATNAVQIVEALIEDGHLD